MLRHKKMTRTRLFGEKEKARARKERKENLAKERILSKECLHGKEKEKEMAILKEVSNKVFHSNNSKQMLHSSHPPQARCLLRTNRETAHAEESWSWDETYWTDDWSWDSYNYYGGYEGDYSQGDWHSWVVLCFQYGTDLNRGQAFRRSADSFCGRTDGPDQPVMFFCHLLVPFYRTWTHAFCDLHIFVHFSVVPVLLQFEQVPHSEHSQFWSKCCIRIRRTAFVQFAHKPSQIRHIGRVCISEL